MVLSKFISLVIHMRLTPLLHSLGSLSRKWSHLSLVPSVFFRNSILEQQVILDHSLKCSTALRINENLKKQNNRLPLLQSNFPRNKGLQLEALPTPRRVYRSQPPPQLPADRWPQGEDSDFFHLASCTTPPKIFESLTFIAINLYKI